MMKRQRHQLAGYTIVELLVAMGLSMLMILALTQVFELIGKTVVQGRAILELSGQTRSATLRLQKDLESTTVSVRAWSEFAQGDGYFEIGEGLRSDMDANADGAVDVVGGPIPTMYGDTDDFMAFTIRRNDSPFQGQIQGSLIGPNAEGKLLVDLSNSAVTTVIESQVAEVVYWLELDDRNRDGVRQNDEYYILYRRVLLIRPDLVFPPQYQSFQRHQFWNANDVSVRFNAAGQPTANSVADLSNRKNRFAHYPTGSGPDGFPYLMAPIAIQGALENWRHPDTTVMPEKLDLVLNFGGNQVRSDRLGEDILLTNVLAFDIRVYDHLAQLRAGGNEALGPGDHGYLGSMPVIGTGAFVDLAYGRQANLNSITNLASVFSGPPDPRSGLTLPNALDMAFYDTWSFDYEHDGLNQDGDNFVDEGTDGVDNPENNNPFDVPGAIDDVGERETSPPYPVPLRGIRITLRVYEPDTRQVRQVMISQDFTPE